MGRIPIDRCLNVVDHIADIDGGFGHDDLQTVSRRRPAYYLKRLSHAAVPRRNNTSSRGIVPPKGHQLDGLKIDVEVSCPEMCGSKGGISARWAAAVGRLRITTNPPSGWFSAENRPLCKDITRATMASPSPVPPLSRARADDTR